MHDVDDIHCNCISVTQSAARCLGSSLLSLCGNRRAALICLISGPAEGHLVKLKFYGNSFLVAFFVTTPTMGGKSTPISDTVKHISLWNEWPISQSTYFWNTRDLPTPLRIEARPRLHARYPRDMLATSSRRCHEDATRKLLTWNSSLIASAPCPAL